MNVGILNHSERENFAHFRNGISTPSLNHSKKLEIINLTKRPVEITYRSGFKVLINSERRGYTGDEVVVFTSTYSLSATSEMADDCLYEDYFKSFKTLNKELKSIYKAYKAENPSSDGVMDAHHLRGKSNRATSQQAELGIRYNPVTVEATVAPVDGSVYVSEFDLVVNFNVNRNFTSVEHPLNLDTFTVEKMKKHFENINGLSINFELVDNDDLLDNRYLNLTGTIYKLTAVKDNSRDNGVYVSTYDHFNEKRTNSFFDITEATEKIGLARSIEEAETNGNSKQLLELEILKAKEELARNEINISELKQESERSMINLRMELLEAEAESKRLKIKSDKIKSDYDKEITTLKSNMEIKEMKEKSEFETNSRIRDDYYDSRSQSRKDTSEILKVIPAVLSVVALGFAIFK